MHGGGSVVLAHFCENHGPAAILCSQTCSLSSKGNMLEEVERRRRDRRRRKKSQDDKASSKRSQRTSQETCEACHLLPGRARCIVSEDADRDKAYVSGDCELVCSEPAYLRLKSSCLRGLSCEVQQPLQSEAKAESSSSASAAARPLASNVVLFSDDAGLNLSYSFHVKDGLARGFRRLYSVVVTLNDRAFLMLRSQSLLQEIQALAGRIQQLALANFVPPPEAAATKLPAPYMSQVTTMTTLRNVRPANLSMITKCSDIAVVVHEHFATILSTLLDSCQESVLCGPPLVAKAREQSSTNVTLRGVASLVTENELSFLLHSVVCGLCVEVTSEGGHHELVNAFLDCFEPVLPEFCFQPTYSAADRSSPGYLHRPSAPAQAHVKVHLEGRREHLQQVRILPGAGLGSPSLSRVASRLAQLLANRRLSDRVVGVALRAVVEEYLTLARARRESHMRRAAPRCSLLAVNNLKPQEAAVVRFWAAAMPSAVGREQ